MAIDQSKRTSFDEVAEIYNEIRGEYPPEMIEDIIRLSGIATDERILEIGCGPGNATVPFAKRGYEILAIELGERLAALAADNCRGYPNVKILNLAFEDWEIESDAFDLVLSTDALHWIPPEISYPKAAKALRSSGSIALTWRAPVDPQTDWLKEIDNIYEKIEPQFVNPDKKFYKRVDD